MTPSPRARTRTLSIAQRRRRTIAGGLVIVVVAVLVTIATSGTAHPTAPLSAHRAAGSRTRSSTGQGVRTARSGSGGSTPTSALPFASGSGATMTAGPNLAPGSNPAVLPSDVLIADNYASRLLIVNPAGTIVWQFPQPGDLAPGQTFEFPDDAFFTPNGRDIIATEENDQVISIISVRQHRILWRYGTPGVPGSGPNQVDNPDDAMQLPNGDIVFADIKNCSTVFVSPGAHVPLERIGLRDTNCYHNPPMRFGSPNGAFPMTNGNYLITEINGDWADEMTPSGHVLWSTHPPGVLYPSDTNEVSPGVYITADYSDPGQVVEFTKTGRLLWRYGPRSGPGMLNTPSLCMPIPTNGDILCNDDSNDRVVVIDPKTDTIVWQYGHTGVVGTAPGYLHQPDGVDLAPPYSLLVRHGPTMGVPTGTCWPGNPPGTCTYGLAATSAG